MTHADASIGICNDPFQDFVDIDRGSVTETEKGVIRKDYLFAQGGSMKQGQYVKQSRCLMPMHDVYVFTYTDLAQYTHREEEGCERILR